MRLLLYSSKGSTLIQVILAMSVVLGLSGYMLKSNQTQNKLQQTVSKRKMQSSIQKEISELLTNGDACLNTLGKLNQLSNRASLQAIYNEDNDVVYQRGAKIYDHLLTGLQLEDYTTGASEKFQVSNLKVTVSLSEAAGTSSFGGKHRSFKIPIFLMTNDNVPVICLSDDSEALLSALKSACESLNGTFDTSSGRCINFHGPEGALLKYVRENLCSSSGIGCVHPYRSVRCNGVDVRGQNHGNWVMRGFAPDGRMSCQCVPVECPDPSQFCAGEDLGTDWCARECGTGTKTGSGCNV